MRPVLHRRGVVLAPSLLVAARMDLDANRSPLNWTCPSETVWLTFGNIVPPGRLHEDVLVVADRNSHHEAVAWEALLRMFYAITTTTSPP